MPDSSDEAPETFTLAEFVKLGFKARYSENTERGTILAQVADLDVALRNAIIRRFIDNKEVLNQTFGEYGPLGNISAKAKVAYLLNIFPERVFKDIVRIATIRNRFAHYTDAKDCNSPSISGQIDGITIVDDFLVPQRQNALFEKAEISRTENFSEFLSEFGFKVKDRNYRLTVAIMLVIAIINLDDKPTLLSSLQT